MMDERLWKLCDNCGSVYCARAGRARTELRTKCPFWEPISCPDCGGILSTVRKHGDKKVRHCYACHFEFEVE